ncbi:hypothetical protein BJ742DRAFT_257430 [Cladochytrium replicatum]|nr:hypothetical protein BJ742DRAFT_257430 [Cladochytrium replicatum]
MHEAEESSRRQGELKRRQLEDEIFRQTTMVHQETVDSYFEEVIADSINARSGIEACRKVHEYVGKINDVVDALQKWLHLSLLILIVGMSSFSVIMRSQRTRRGRSCQNWFTHS